MKYRKTALAIFLLVLIILGMLHLMRSEKARISHQRRLTLSDFGFLEIGMSLKEITERVGKPDRDVGSGIFLIQYDLADGRTLQLIFVDPDKLLGAQIREKDGTWTDLFGKEN